MRRNGKLVRVKPDGAEDALDTPSLAPMSAAEIETTSASRRDGTAAARHEGPYVVLLG